MKDDIFTGLQPLTADHYPIHHFHYGFPIFVAEIFQVHYYILEEMEAEEGELRKIHIIYFLSRMGRIEHPHLIRVHHPGHNGVHLQDVKRWLSELRGKDMPDSFSWSYKLKYKMGYVWQDVSDEDLVIPISDNEYVLKGSDIYAISSSFEPCSCGGKKISAPKPNENVNNNENDDQEKARIFRNDKDLFGPLDYSETLTSSSGTTTTTDESAIFSIKSDSFISNPEVQVLQENDNSIQMEELEGIEDSLGKKKEKEKNKKGGGATNVLRSLLNCHKIDTNDAAMMMINNHRKMNDQDNNICTTENGDMESFRGGSERIFGGTCWNLRTQHQHSIRSCRREKSKKVSDAAFKPVSEPHCSQCGKGFKPEKLHSHMKSCRGLKSLSKNGGATKETNMNYFSAK